MWDNMVIEGFQFESASQYTKAKREAEAIDYIKLKMDLSEPRTAAKVYYKLLEKGNLKTVVGLSFLKQLRDYIVAEGVVREEDLKSIIVTSGREGGDMENVGDETALELSGETDENEKKPFEDSDETKEKKLKSVVLYYRQRAKKTAIVIAFLVIIIIAMFIITLKSNNSPFADAEAAMQDKYAGWAEELENWEHELEYREEQLILNEKQLP